MEQHQRIQQRYERLLRERAAASLMREAAAALAQVAGHEATYGVATIPQWTPRPAHQAADAMRGAGAHYGAAAPAPAAATSSSAGRHPQSQPLDLSRQTSHQWRPVGASGDGGATVRGAHQAHSAPAVGSSTTYAPAAIAFTAYIPVVRTSAFYAHATGLPATYSQAPRASAMHGPATGLSTSQAQQAGHSATFAHVAEQPPTYKPAQRKERNMQPISFAMHQSPASSPYYYTDHQSTSTLRHGYYAPRMAANPSHQCPLVTSGSGERIYPQAGYPPAPSSVARPNQCQTVPCYTISGPQAYPPTIVYQQYWPATSKPQPASTHGHQPEPSRQKPTKRAIPSSGRSSPFLEPRYHRPVTPGTPPPPVQEGAVSSAGQPPSQEPVEATSEAHSNVMKSDPVKSEIKPLEMISVEVKQEDQGFDIPIKKEPEEEIKDVNLGEDKAGVKPNTEINPEANVAPVVGVDLKEDPDGDVEEDIDLEEYETGQEEDAKAGEESSCSDGEDEQPGDATSQQVPLPPSAPWATVGGAGPLRGPRRNTCRQCGRASIPGLLCFSCCCTFQRQAPATVGGTGCGVARGSGSARGAGTTAGRQRAEKRTCDSSVQVNMDSESEGESYSTESAEEMEEEGVEDEEHGEEEGEEEQEDAQEEEEQQEDDDHDQQGLENEAVKQRRKPHELPPQDVARGASAAPEACEEDKHEGQGGEKGRH